jgi:hypothetical protein
MRKHHREVRALVRGIGLELLELQVSGGSHLVCHVRNLQGERFQVLVPNTPSDRRWVMNARSEFRRLVAGVGRSRCRG